MPSHSRFSRRALLQAAAAISGATAGAQLIGPLVPTGLAAEPEPAHFVHIFFNGGLNALFAGCADKYLTAGSFGVTSSNIVRLGANSSVYVDKATFGTLALDAAGNPKFAHDHWAAIGLRHRNALHTTPQNRGSGGERAILRDGGNCYLNQLAYYMGGDSAYKAVFFGDRQPAYEVQPAFQKVALQQIVNLNDPLKNAGAAAIDPNAPVRDLSADALESAQQLSARDVASNPAHLTTLGDSYASAVESLRKMPPKPVTLEELSTAYKLNGNAAVNTWRSMIAGAELMIRAAGSNVINITDFGLASWDFHQTDSGTERVGKSRNGEFSRTKFLGTNGIKPEDRITPIRTFLDRMLNLPDRNVVVCISGELVRTLNGDHGDGTVAVLLGKYVKQGVSYGVDSQSRFSNDTPGTKGFWAAVAAALRVPGEPFGPNPHAALIA